MCIRDSSYVFAAIITLMTRLRGQIAWTVAMLVGYWAIMALIPVPGFGRNVLTQQGNLEGYIDRLFLPGKFCCYVFGDNEGYLSTIPSIATVMLGVLCTHMLQAKRSERFKVLALVGGGLASLALGLAWGMVFPIITRLWTSSYTLYSNGWCMLPVSYTHLDVYKRQGVMSGRGRPAPLRSLLRCGS